MAIRAPGQIAGVDGCKVGWIAVTFRAEVQVFETFASLVGALYRASIIGIDMPIGLPECAIKGGRKPDWEAKTFLCRRNDLSGAVATGRLRL
jgi:predicted RNase H-like nuclease